MLFIQKSKKKVKLILNYIKMTKKCPNLLNFDEFKKKKKMRRKMKSLKSNIEKFNALKKNFRRFFF